MEKSDSNSSDTARPWQSYNTVYTNSKAGMEGVDKEKVQRVVYEMSKGSKYFENEERKEVFIRQKIDSMRARYAELTPSQLSHYQKVSDKRILELEAKRDLSKIWLHVDMDAFYAAVETLTNPSLKGKPMAVGSLSMISTANYEARRYGVRAAMPGFIACKLCPELVFVPTDFKKYTYYSDLTRKVFQKYDPNFMAASLDEAYLDITEVCRERGVTGEEIARELRVTVYEETGLTCSAGVAPNRLLAKVCSDINKPNGQFVLANDRMAVATFISSLLIRKVGGIGKVTEQILRDVFGINTCEELLQKSNYLCALFSQSTADFFLCVGLGIGKTDTPKVQQRKSISNERTFSATEDEKLLYQKLAELAELLSDDLRKGGLQAKTLTLKLKTASFEVRTRAVTLPKYICSTEEILKHASKLLKAELPVSLRLIGLRASHFREDNIGPPDPTQPTLANFILGNSSRKARMDPSSSGSHCTNLCPVNDFDNDSSIDSCQTTHLELGNPLDRLDTPDLDDTCPLTKVHGESLGDAFACEDEVAASHLEVSCKTHQNVKSSNFLKSPALVSQFGVSSSLGDVNGKENIHRDEEPSCKQQGQVLWLHDYKCSLCGIELPPCFIEERQEHSDFHLAERLQKEEHGSTSRMLEHRQRFREKDQSASSSKHKKQKLSLKGSGHLPINLFFEKKCENS